MDRSDNVCTGITGERADGKTVPEEDNYYICDDCGQAVDMRKLGEVFHHEGAGHKPLPVS